LYGRRIELGTLRQLLHDARDGRSGVIVVRGEPGIGKSALLPLDDSSRLSAQLVKDATLKIYPGAPHGLANTTVYKDIFNNDLLGFLRG
jgi:non-heme chloroperoxidase